MEKMSELLAFSFQAINLPFTILLIVTLLYWLSVILGAMDVDILDVDLDFDGDADLDVDADIDVDADVDIDAPTMGVGFVMLRFMNVGRVPLAIILSILFVTMWTCSILGNYHLNPLSSKLIAAGLAVPNIIASLMITKVVSTPFAWLFAQLTVDTVQSEDLTGKICVVTTSEVTPTFGQAEVNTGGAPLLVSVRTDGGEELKRGDQAVVMSFDKTKDIYIISKLEV